MMYRDVMRMLTPRQVRGYLVLNPDESVSVGGPLPHAPSVSPDRHFFPHAETRTGLAVPRGTMGCLRNLSRGLHARDFLHFVLAKCGLRPCSVYGLSLPRIVNLSISTTLLPWRSQSQHGPALNVNVDSSQVFRVPYHFAFGDHLDPADCIALNDMSVGLAIAAVCQVLCRSC